MFSLFDFVYPARSFTLSVDHQLKGSVRMASPKTAPGFASHRNVKGPTQREGRGGKPGRLRKPAAKATATRVKPSPAQGTSVTDTPPRHLFLFLRAASFDGGHIAEGRKQAVGWAAPCAEVAADPYLEVARVNIVVLGCLIRNDVWLGARFSSCRLPGLAPLPLLRRRRGNLSVLKPRACEGGERWRFE